jgi:predicted nucleotidyltransferase component of viral defense system
MILKREIEKIAEQKGVAKTTIDKDWVLGHFTDAIFSVPECRQNLVFKGGTCLKKCYFEDYRFSEDLDFTSINPDFVFSKKLLEKIVSIVAERTEIPLHIQKLEQLVFKDRLTGFSAIIKYWGADHPRNLALPPVQRWLTSIKIEVILYEEMVFSPETRTIQHAYSDMLSDEINTGIPCYSVQEILAEKLRALIQRSYTAPRDFYDIWYLSGNIPNLDWQQIKAAFLQKMKFKNLEFTGIEQMINPENDKQLEAAWKNSLVHQVNPDYFPEYNKVRDVLKSLLSQVFNADSNTFY